MRTVFVNLSVSLAVLLLLALGLEAGLRLFAPQIPIVPDGIYAGDPHLRYLPNPNAVGRYRTTEYDTRITINSQGFRDYERPLQKSAGTFRILCLGDSFTLGAEEALEQTYPKTLERVLKNQMADSLAYEVVNGGVGGYGTYQELLFLQRVGLSVQPDIVLVQFFSNDVRDNIAFQQFLIDTHQDSLIAAAGVPPVLPDSLSTSSEVPKATLNQMALLNLPPSLRSEAKTFLSEHSHVYHLLRARFNILKSVLGLEPMAAFDDLMIMQKSSTPELDAGWALTERLYLRMRDLLAERQMRMVLVVVPNKAQVSESWRYDAWVKEHRLDLGIPGRRLVAFGKANDIPVLDLQPLLQATGKGQNLFYKWDGHWNAQGTEEAGKAVARFLAEKGLVPGKSRF